LVLVLVLLWRLLLVAVVVVVDGVEAALAGVLLGDGQGDASHTSGGSVAEVVGTRGDGALGGGTLGVWWIRGGSLAPGAAVRITLWGGPKWGCRLVVIRVLGRGAGGVWADASCAAAAALCGLLTVASLGTEPVEGRIRRGLLLLLAVLRRRWLRRRVVHVLPIAVRLLVLAMARRWDGGAKRLAFGHGVV
jgi:hypothetical protein